MAEQLSGLELDPIAFAEKLLGLLDTGRKTATYKFATLTALIDVCVERAAADGEQVDLSARELGRRVFDLLWQHAVPYSAEAGEQRYLRHSVLNKERQPDLVVKIERFRHRHGLIGKLPPERARSAAPVDFDSLLDEVQVTVIRMPLPRLQCFRVAGKVVEDRFLYEYCWQVEESERVVRQANFDDRLQLRPGVAAMLARLGALLRPVIEARWAAFVADRSHDLVGDHDLADFLFGADRISLTPVRAPLVSLQEGDCFYCLEALGASADVDHFIPWRRHPDNGIHNLVAAHPTCNNRKRDSLAASGHLAHWIQRNQRHQEGLGVIASQTKWPGHPERTLGAARASYLWLPDGTSLWVKGWDYEPLDRGRTLGLLD